MTPPRQWPQSRRVLVLGFDHHDNLVLRKGLLVGEMMPFPGQVAAEQPLGVGVDRELGQDIKRRGDREQRRDGDDPPTPTYAVPGDCRRPGITHPFNRVNCHRRRAGPCLVERGWRPKVAIGRVFPGGSYPPIPEIKSATLSNGPGTSGGAASAQALVPVGNLIGALKRSLAQETG
jgi:hypothetical protein